MCVSYVFSLVFSCLDLSFCPSFAISYKVLCPSVVKDSMTGEQIARKVLETIGIDEAVYRMGFNKVVIVEIDSTLDRRSRQYFENNIFLPAKIRSLTVVH